VPGHRARRVRLQDVAAELGVSAKTVSNAFTRPDQLSARLRGQVLDAAERLGYPGPDPLAAGLRRGRVGSIGVAYDTELSYAFDDPVAVAVLAGLTSVAERAGSGLLLVPGSATDRAARITGAVVDGLVVNSVADDDSVLRAALARRMPVVVIDQPYPEHLRSLSSIAPCWAGIDDRSAARQAADHLLRLGHRRLAVVSFSLTRDLSRAVADEDAQARSTYAVTRARLAGYRDAVVAHGGDWATVAVIEAGGSGVDDGRRAAETVLAHEPAPTALLCLSDRLAEGAVEAGHRRGLRVPDDVSIVGFDDAEPARRLGMTTIHQPHRRKGEIAARALLDLLDAHEPDPITVLPTELVIRASTAPPPP
jgi:DNA-binding LacI/PurR family transcriptional regulator